MLMHNDRNVMVKFKPGEYMRKVFFFSVRDTKRASLEKIPSSFKMEDIV